MERIQCLKNRPTATDWPLWLTRRETADYLWQVHGQKFGVAALANAAIKAAGAGPPFHKQGGVRVSYWRPTWMSGRRCAGGELARQASFGKQTSVRRRRLNCTLWLSAANKMTAGT